jgi:hypothetical protein
MQAYINSVRTSQETHHVSQLSLFIVRLIQNAQIHCVTKMQSFVMLKVVVHIVTDVKGLVVFNL